MDGAAPKDGMFEISLAERDGRLESDRCAWCGDRADMSRSHVIPKLCGSRFAPFISCTPCNNFIGSHIESKAKKNAYIQAALVKLGLQARRGAYRDAELIDTMSGAEMYIDEGGKANVIPGELEDGGFRGSPSQMKRYHVAQLRKEHPDVSASPLEDFFDDVNATHFKFAGKTYVKENYNEEKTKVRIEASRDISPDLIFKMAYEFLVVAGFMDHPWFNRCLRSFIRIRTDDPQHRIVLADDLSNYVFGNTSNTFTQGEPFEDIPFFDANYFVLRLSRNLVLYLEVTLFGQLRNFFILGRWPQHRDELNWWFDHIILMPQTGSVLLSERYRTLKGKNHIIWADAAVEARLFQIEERLSSKSSA